MRMVKWYRLPWIQNNMILTKLFSCVGSDLQSVLWYWLVWQSPRPKRTYSVQHWSQSGGMEIEYGPLNNVLCIYHGHKLRIFAISVGHTFHEWKWVELTFSKFLRLLNISKIGVSYSIDHWIPEQVFSWSTGGHWHAFSWLYTQFASKSRLWSLQEFSSSKTHVHGLRKLKTHFRD